MEVQFISENKNNILIIDIKELPYYKIIETEISLSLHPILESWSNQILSPNHNLFGIRRYLRGAYLHCHVDRLPTHVISAILQVAITGSSTIPIYIYMAETCTYLEKYTSFDGL